MTQRRAICLAIVSAALWFPTYAFGGEVSLSAHMRQLTDGEMGAYHGGFTAPGGLEIDIGLSLASATSALSGGAGGQNVGQIQYTASGGQIILQNSLSNMSLEAITQLNVDVGNYSKLRAAGLGQNLIGGVGALPLFH